MGTFDKSVNFDDEALYVNDKKILMTNHRTLLKPIGASWESISSSSHRCIHGSCSTRKTSRGGAKKVLLTVPPKDDIDAMVVYKVNDEILEKNQDHLECLMYDQLFGTIGQSSRRSIWYRTRPHDDRSRIYQ